MTADETRPKRKKPKYSAPSNIAYMLRLMWKTNLTLIITTFLWIPLAFLGNLVAIYLPTVIINAISAEKAVGYVVAVIIGVFAVKLLVGLANMLVKWIDYYSGNIIQLAVCTFISDKSADLDYEQLIDPEIKQVEGRLYRLHKHNGTDACMMPSNFGLIITNVINMVVFGGVIGSLNPLVALLLIIPTVINFILELRHQKYSHEREENEGDEINNRNWYFTNWMYRRNSVKDVLLFGLRGRLRTLAGESAAAYRSYKRKIYRHSMLKNGVRYALEFIRDGAAYVYLIWRGVNGGVTAGEFVLYFSIIGSFSGYVEGIFSHFSQLRQGAVDVGDLREYLAIPSKFNRGKGVPVPKTAPSVEFVNVSYKYPEAEEPTVKNISFKINAGEKVALVGLNGAGKTTVIKLLCGMYRQTEGKILIDGHEIDEYNRDEYYGMITALFQSFTPLPLTIKQNITSTSDTVGVVDEERLERAVRFADLGGYLAKLPRGIDTKLVKSVNDGAANPSGGELQRILLARAYYNERPLLVLDEPTAALDPIAESKMYGRYAEFASDKTSVFISHRLASTRFCGRILYLENGSIAESGSHEELLARGGKYAELFDVQSRYYRDDPDGKNAGKGDVGNE